MLKGVSQLTTKQLAELDVLCADCKQSDGNIVPLYKHIIKEDRPLACNILYYQQNKLIGFMSSFFFYEDACEISIMVAPTFRRQGIATKMMKEALPQLSLQGIKNLIFSAPHNLNANWLSANEFHYQRSEYQMERLKPTPIISTDNVFSVRPASIDDLAMLCAIDSACFSTHQPNLIMRTHQLLNDDDYKLFIAEASGSTIGKAHIHCQKRSARLTDIAILPEFQRQGYGSKLLIHCINYCLTNKLGNIYLDVEANNQHALNLYLRLGFIVINAYDFWIIPIQSLLDRFK